MSEVVYGVRLKQSDGQLAPPLPFAVKAENVALKSGEDLETLLYNREVISAAKDIVTVQADNWVTEKYTWSDITCNYKNRIEVKYFNKDTDIDIQFVGGSLESAQKWRFVEFEDDAVILWSDEKPAKDFILSLSQRGNVTALSNEQLKDIMLMAHPIGSIYESFDSTNPEELFGGKWEQIKDRFILAAGDNYNAEAIGGTDKVVLQANEMPAHSHTVYNTNGASVSTYPFKITYSGDHCGDGAATDRIGWMSTVGGSQAHENMPPYIVAYMWRRIA